MPRHEMQKTQTFPRTLSELATLWLAALLCLWSGIALAGQLTTHYTYDEAGNKTSQTDAQGRVTRWGYTLTNQVASRTLPDGKTEYFTYDDLGNLSTHTDFAGQVTRYAYDELDRPTTVAHPDGRTVKTTYTKTGQVETVTETRTVNGKKVSLVTRYAYDINDRLLKVTNPDNRFISYGYDLAGNITSRSTVNGTTAYEYDVMNRLAKVTDSQGGVTTYTYDAAGRLLTTTYPNGTDGLREYDDNGHLLQVAWRQTATGQVVTATRYTLLPNGMRETLTRFDGQSTLQVTSVPGANGQSQSHWELGNPATEIGYTYDSLQRLTGEHQVSHRQDSPYQELTNRWTYDSTGNRLTQEHTVLGWSGSSSVETTSYNYDSRDRLLSSTLVSNTGSSVTTTFDWDDNGRLVRKASPGEVTLYGWRSDDRLLTVKRGATDATAGLVAAYDYDAEGNRNRKLAEDGIVINYLMDSNFAYAQAIEEFKVNPATNIGELTTYALGGDLIASFKSANSIYYHADAISSVTAQTSGVGLISQSYEYQAFGEGVVDSMANKVVGYGYAGEYKDEEVIYSRARWMDPVAGRFISMDAYAGNYYSLMVANRYIYANDAPINYVDHSGFNSVSTVMDSAAANAIFGVLFMIPMHMYVGSIQNAGYNASGSSDPNLNLGAVMNSAHQLPSDAVAKLLDIVTHCHGEINGRSKVCNVSTPAILYGQDVLQHTEFVAESQRSGAKSLLHRSPSVFSRRWFNLSFLQPTNCTGKTGGNTGMDCDEYPYYSTLEGGLVNYLANSVFLKPVNKAHNRAAGGLLGGFYSAAQVSPMLGEFYTIPMVDLAKTIYVHK